MNISGKKFSKKNLWKFTKKTASQIKNNKLKIYGCLSVLFLIWFIMLFFTPFGFTKDTVVRIENGSSINDTADILKEEKIIRSNTLFSAIVSLLDANVVSGDYLFTERTNLISIIYRVTNGIYGIPFKKITFNEGLTVREMGKVIKDYLPEFDSDHFIELATDKEGYLFPDTYFIRENASPEDVIEMMNDTFYKKIDEAGISYKNEEDLSKIIIIASIVEKEATTDTRQEVSDIIWKRLSEDLLLQVDAPFVYSIGKGTFDLTKEDLNSENPYNTYKNIGLPPTPISNPGIESIKAASNPSETDHLYFLTGHDGKMYFANDFEGHKKNRLLYLD